jgi:uncharacterized transporter YbjL
MLQGEDTALVPGTLVTVVGSPVDVEKLLQTTGKASNTALPADPSNLDVTDLRVSNHQVCGRPIRELEVRHEGLIISASAVAMSKWRLRPPSFSSLVTRCVSYLTAPG